MTNFLSTGTTGGEKYNREGLTKWATSRFETELADSEFRGKQPESIEKSLQDYSRNFLSGGTDIPQKIDEQIGKFFGENGQNGSVETKEHVHEKIATWANDEFHANLEPTEFKKLSRDATEQKLLHVADERFRPNWLTQNVLCY